MCHITWLSTNQVFNCGGIRGALLARHLYMFVCKDAQQTYFPTSEIRRHAIDTKIYVLRDYIN